MGKIVEFPSKMDKNGHEGALVSEYEKTIRRTRKRAYAGFRAGWVAFCECTDSGDKMAEKENAWLLMAPGASDFADGWRRGWRAAWHTAHDCVEGLSSDDLTMIVALSVDRRTRDVACAIPLIGEVQ